MAHPINGHLEAYAESFAASQSQHDLPREWFRRPDHLAIKCADRIDYEMWCRVMEPYTDENGIWAIDLDGRSLASAQLTRALPMYGYGFGWVEIMQPRPGKETALSFMEHSEFTVPGFYTVCRVLEEKGLDYERRDNRDEAGVGHSWVNLGIDDEGREIKFNDLPLAELVPIERAAGKLYKVEV